MLLWLAANCAVMICSAPASAQGLSADLISRNPEQSLPVATLYAADGKIRIDVPSSQANANGPSYAAFTIWYAGGAVRFSPRPKKWTADDAKREVIFFVELNDLTFQPVPDAALCPQYISHIGNLSGAESNPKLKKILKQTGCQDLGLEEVQGRKLQKLTIAYPQQKGFTMWIDPELHFVMKVVHTEISIELQNVKTGEQPAKLFTIPVDARSLL
jgi:hypothetical protein